MYEIGSKWFLKQRFVKLNDFQRKIFVEFEYKFDKYFELTYEDNENVYLTNDSMTMKVAKETLPIMFVEDKY